MNKCNDKECDGYGRELVDRGYGYPVCPTNAWMLMLGDVDKHYKGDKNE